MSQREAFGNSKHRKGGHVAPNAANKAAVARAIEQLRAPTPRQQPMFATVRALMGARGRVRQGKQRR